jgi:hypothetical protein
VQNSEIFPRLCIAKNIRERIFNSFAALKGQPHQDLQYFAKVLD